MMLRTAATLLFALAPTAAFAGAPETLRALPASNPAWQESWDDEVERVLLGLYDANGSGKIDAKDELYNVDCATWQAIDDGTRTKWSGSGLRTIYGFDEAFIWVGYAIGVDETLRATARDRFNACGIDSSQHGPAAPMAAPSAPAGTTGGKFGTEGAAAGPSQATAIAAIPGGGSSEWDGQVMALLVAAYDADRSGTLQTPAEVSAIPCDTWQAIDAGVRQQWAGGLRQTYGFSPDLIWVGYAIGIDEGMRPTASARAEACGLTTESYSTGGGGAGGGDGTPAGTIRAAGGTQDFDDTVTRVLLGSYDANGSGSIDNGKELKAIPCAIWEAMDAGTRAEWSSGVRVIYGFRKDLIWVGYAFGIDEKLRKAADKQLLACGLAG